jgi:hypothetical protein
MILSAFEGVMNLSFIKLIDAVIDGRDLIYRSLEKFEILGIKF